MGSGKASLLKKEKNAKLKALNLRNKAKILEESYTALEAELRPEIDKFTHQADEIAPDFRRLYRESQDAYESKARATAKSLSIQGHIIENRCRSLNNQANILRSRLRELRDRIDELYLKAKKAETKAEEYRLKAEDLRATVIKNFTKSVISNEEIEEFLDEFPQKIFKHISSVQYYYKEPLFGTEIFLGQAPIDPKTGKTNIIIFSHDNKNKLKETLSHEIGHVVFRKVMNDAQRWEWGLLCGERLEKRLKFVTDYAAAGREDNFCECFAYFKTRPSELLKKFEKEYDFIKNIYSKIP